MSCAICMTILVALHGHGEASWTGINRWFMICFLREGGARSRDESRDHKKSCTQYHMPSLRRIKMKIISSGNVFFSAWVYLHQHRFDRYGKLFQLHRRTILYIFGIIIVMILSNYLNNYYICSSIRTSTYNLSYVTYYLFYINMNVNKSYPYYSLNFITMFAKPNR